MLAEDRYPTRHGGAPAMLRREEPVLWQGWHASAPLSSTQCRQWRDQGFLVLPDLLTAGEVDILGREATRLQADRSLLKAESAIREADSKDLRSLFQPQKYSGAVAKLLRDDRLLDIAEFLLDSEVYAHQSRINYKPAFRGGGFYWHSDFETWHAEDGLPLMRTVSMSILLTDNTSANGPLLLVPGSHRWFLSCPERTPEGNFRKSLRDQRIGIPGDTMIATLASDGIHACTGHAGTVVVFDCNTLHGSANNISPWPRSNLFFVYNSTENLPGAPYCGRAPRPSFVAERRDFRALRNRSRANPATEIRHAES